jgi:lysophospholipase L1-like esterase
MITFLERWRGKARSLATFGDSITQALHIDPPEARWANRLATQLGVTLVNRGLSGTVLQNSPDASGHPRAGNGRSRYEADLLGSERCDLIAILYGTNDARYTAAPATLNHDGFVRDYRAVLAGLFGAGYAPETIVIGSPPHLSDAGFAIGAQEGFAGQTRERFQRYVGTVRSIARATGTYYAPINEAMTSPEADALLLADHVHPNAAGHACIAEIFAGATQLTTETSP